MTITISQTAPVAVIDTYYARSGQTLTVTTGGVLSNDTDAENDPLTAILVTSVQHGTLVLNANGTFTYTPNAGYTGIDRFTYQASDGLLTSNTATVTIVVVNQAIVATDDAYDAIAGFTLTTTAGNNVLANDVSIDGRFFTAVLVTNVQHGTLTLRPDGTFDYVPDAGYTGTDRFTYQADNGSELSNIATVTITVTRQAPVARDDSYSLNKGQSISVTASQGVLVNDYGVYGATLTVVLISNVQRGTLTLQPNGSFTYVPAANYSGTDRFTYQVTDGHSNSSTATVTLYVLPSAPTPTSGTPGYTASGPGLTPSAAANLNTIAPGSPIQGAGFGGLNSIKADAFTAGFHGAEGINANTSGSGGLTWAAGDPSYDPATDTLQLSAGATIYRYGYYGYGLGGYYGYGLGGYYGYGLGGYYGYGLGGYPGYGLGGYYGGIYGGYVGLVGYYGYYGYYGYLGYAESGTSSDTGSNDTTTWSHTYSVSSSSSAGGYSYSASYEATETIAYTVGANSYSTNRTWSWERASSGDWQGNSSFSESSQFSTNTVNTSSLSSGPNSNDSVNASTRTGTYEASGQVSPESSSWSSSSSESVTSSSTQALTQTTSTANQSTTTSSHTNAASEYSIAAESSYSYTKEAGASLSLSLRHSDSGTTESRTETQTSLTYQTATGRGSELINSATNASSQFSSSSSSSSTSTPTGFTGTGERSGSNSGSSGAVNTIRGQYTFSTSSGNPGSGNGSTTDGVVEYLRANSSTFNYTNANSGSSEATSAGVSSTGTASHTDSGERSATFALLGNDTFTGVSTDPQSGEVSNSTGSENFFQNSGSSDKFTNTASGTVTYDGRGKSTLSKKSKQNTDGTTSAAFGVSGAIDTTRVVTDPAAGSIDSTKATEQYSRGASSEQSFEDRITRNTEDGVSSTTTHHLDSGTDATDSVNQIEERTRWLVIDPQTGDVSRATYVQNNLYQSSATDEFTNRKTDTSITSGGQTNRSTNSTHTESGIKTSSYDEQGNASFSWRPSDGLSESSGSSTSSSYESTSDEYDQEATETVTVTGSVTVRESYEIASGSNSETSSRHDTDFTLGSSADGATYSKTKADTTEWNSHGEYRDESTATETLSGSVTTSTRSINSSESGSDSESYSTQNSNWSSQPLGGGGRALASNSESIQETFSSQYSKELATTESKAAGVASSTTSVAYSGSDSGTIVSQGTQSASGEMNGGTNSTFKSFSDRESSSNQYSNESVTSQTNMGGVISASRALTSINNGMESWSHHEQGSNSLVYPWYEFTLDNTTNESSVKQFSGRIDSSLTDQAGLTNGTTSTRTSETETNSSNISQSGGFWQQAAADNGMAESIGTFAIVENSGRTRTLVDLDVSNEAAGVVNRNRSQTLHETGFNSLSQSDQGANTYSGISHADETYKGSGSFSETSSQAGSFTFHETSNLSFDASGNPSGTVQSTLDETATWSGGRDHTESLGIEGVAVDSVIVSVDGSGTQVGHQIRSMVLTSGLADILDSMILQTLATETYSASNTESSFTETTTNNSTVTSQMDGPPGSSITQTVTGGPVTTQSGTPTAVLAAAREADALGGGTRDVLAMLMNLISQAYGNSGEGESSLLTESVSNGNPAGFSLRGMGTMALDVSSDSTQGSSSQGGVWNWIVGTVSYVATKADQAVGVAGNLVLTGTLVEMDSTSGLDLIGAGAYGLTTGGKAVVNGATTAARSTFTLGIKGDRWELIPVTDYDRANGYDLSAGVAQGGFDVLISVGTGGAASALAKGGKISRTASGVLVLFDASQNAVGVAMAADDMSKNGMTRANMLQAVANGAGLAASPVPKAAFDASADAAKNAAKGTKLASAGGALDDFGKEFVKRIVPAPSGVGGLISSLKGHIPDAAKWIKNGGRVINHPDGSITYIKNGISIVYNSLGYPNFSKYLYQGAEGLNEVRITLASQGSKATRHRLDQAAANLAAGFTKTPANFIWHHNQDLGLMQLVDEKVHSQFWHSGGMSLNRNR